MTTTAAPGAVEPSDPSAASSTESNVVLNVR
jgi:hypothetical protein